MLSRALIKKQRGRRPLTALAVLGLLSGMLLAGGFALATVPNNDFELEGDTLDAAAAGDDWATLFEDTEDAGANFDGFSFIPDGSGNADTTYWTGGGSKDRNDIASWQFTTNDQSPDKNDIVNAFAAIYRNGNDTLFFGADRFAVNGDAQMGFWFLSNPICLSGQTTGSIVCPNTNPGKFLDPNTGEIAHHANGDLLVLVNFNNGGTLGLAGVYKWEGGLNGAPVQQLVGTGADCKEVTDLSFCSTSNTANLTNEPIWGYTGKGGIDSYKTSAFIEGGIDLGAIPGVAACFPTFLAETRSSSGPSTGLSLDAQLKDLAFGQFELCQPSTSLGASSNVTIEPGGNTTLSFTETNDGNEDLENVSVTVDNGCSTTLTDDGDGDSLLEEGESWTFECTVSPTGTTTYNAYGVGTGVDSGILVTGNPTCTPSASVVCSEAERASVTVKVVDAFITIDPDDVNEVGDPHTFNVTVKVDNGTGTFVNAPDGTKPTVTLTDANGAVQDISSNTCSGAGTTDGQCSVTFTSDSAGVITGDASVTLTLGGISVSRSTDDTGDNSDIATKRFVDAYITIGPPEATNTVGDPHTFTVTLFQDDGIPMGGAGGDAASGFTPALVGNVDVTLTNDATSNYVINTTLSTCDDNQPSGDNLDANGQCTIVFTSNTAGTVTGNATGTVTLGGVTLTRSTDGNAPNSGPAVKHFVAGSLKWTKVDNGGSLQGGATFTVCKTQNYNLVTEMLENIPVADQVCVDILDNQAGPPADADAANGKFQLNGLSLGTYCVTEKTAPAGFLKDPDTECASLVPEDTDKTIATAFVNNREILKITGFGYTNEAAAGQTRGIVSGTTVFTVNLKNYGTSVANLTNSTLKISVVGAGTGTLVCNGNADSGLTRTITGTIAAGATGGPYTVSCTYTGMADGAVITADLVVKSTTNTLEREASGSPAKISFTVQAD